MFLTVTKVSFEIALYNSKERRVQKCNLCIKFSIFGSKFRFNYGSSYGVYFGFKVEKKKGCCLRVFAVEEREPDGCRLMG